MVKNEDDVILLLSADPYTASGLIGGTAGLRVP